MDSGVVRMLLPAGQAEPTDEETLQAMLVLFRRLAPRESGGIASTDASTADPWLTPSAAAEYAAVSEDTLRSWIAGGHLRAGRVGRVIRLRRSDIDALLAGQGGGGDEAKETGASDREGAPMNDTSRSILTSLRSRRRAKK